MKLKYILRSLAILAIFSLAIFSCKKDIKQENIIPDPIDTSTHPISNVFPIPSASPVTGSVSGLVVDENNQPVNNAQVRLGATVVSSDAAGLFNFTTTILDKYFTTVTVTMPGYFKAYRTFQATPTKNYISIKLIPKTLAGTVNSSNAENVSLSNNSSISFQANGFVVKATGAAYTGTVNVYASYIDPTASDISSIVPGCFIGKDANNIYVLGSAGMMAVELESTTGEVLQLATNKPATLKMIIPSSRVAEAPTTINSWSLNDAGIWQKEGTATKSGNFYEAQVTHFSFWNYDVPINAVYLSLHIQDQVNHPMVNTLVSLTDQSGTAMIPTTHGYTDSLGNVSGIIPAGAPLVMNVFNDAYSCNTALATQNIGPFTNANNSLSVSINLPASQQLSITGTATDCFNQPLASGTASIFVALLGYYYTSIVNGNYSLVIPISQCSPPASINVTAVNNSDGAQASSGSIAVSSNTITVPSLQACNAQPAIFTLNCSGAGYFQASGTYYTNIPLTAGNIVNIYVNVTTAGSYNIVSQTYNGMTFSGSGIFTTLGPNTVTLTGVGTPMSSLYTYIPINLPGGPCSIYMLVNDPPAQYETGGPGACTGITISGNFYTNWQGGGSITLPVNVTFPGLYTITTDTVNGAWFTGSGHFYNTGTQLVTLIVSGTLVNAGLYTYTTHASNGSAGCSFDITAIATLAAQIQFECYGTCGAGECNSTTPGLQPSYTLNYNDSLVFYVTVISPGTWQASTGGGCGFGYSGSGTFTTAGTNQPMALHGNGTTPPGGSMLCFFNCTVTGGPTSQCSALVNIL